MEMNIVGDEDIDHCVLPTEQLPPIGMKKCGPRSASPGSYGNAILSPSPVGDNEETLRTCKVTKGPDFGDVLADWIIEKSQVQNHNGEFPLFNQDLLSSRKDEQLSGQTSLQSPKPSRAGRRGQLFCTLEQSHKYLMASVSESSVNDLAIDLKPQIATYTVQFGRPTRASLLRSAHQSASLSRNIQIEQGLQKRTASIRRRFRNMDFSFLETIPESRFSRHAKRIIRRNIIRDKTLMQKSLITGPQNQLNILEENPQRSAQIHINTVV
ncbi:uncharacterized protein LOC142465411 isoform X2 [Ascaphus truei]|uniref:uncharacterized protein LOC142465411 isoform X2 n=1 Tax=Ascaphus truei TaxID=8439 RepID=UPI003F59DE10